MTIFEIYKKNKQKINVFKIIFITVLIGLFIFLYLGSKSLLHLSDTIIANPLVYDLSQFIESTQIHFGKINCKDSTSKCFTLPDFKTENWQNISLSKTDIRTLPGFNQKGGFLQYRIKFKVPPLLWASNEPIAIIIYGVYLYRYQYYLNGIKLSDTHSQTNIESIGQFNLPRSYLSPKGEGVITIEAEYQANDTGILNRLSDLIGPKSLLMNLLISEERGRNTYYLVFFCIKLSIFAIFTLLFILNKTQPFLKYFLFYAFFVGADSILVGDLLSDHLDFRIKVLFFFNLQLLGFISLWKLVESLLHFKMKYQRFLIPSMVLILNFLIYCYYNAYLQIELDHIFKVHLILVDLILAQICGVLIYHYIKNPKLIVADTPILQILIIFLSYFIFTIIQKMFLEKLGFNQRHVVDILFFFGISYITFREFAANQIRLEEQIRIVAAQADDVKLGLGVTRLAHDLRKPFHNFRLALKSKESANTNPEYLKQVNEQILKSIDYAESIIEDVLNLKRKAILNLTPMSTTELIDQVNFLFLNPVREKQIIIEVENKTDGTLMIDKSKILSALQNIIVNGEESFKYQTDKADKTDKKIWFLLSEIETTLGEKKCRIVIGNNGPPIPNEVLNRLFKEKITHGKTNGTGIGLSEVKNSIEMHNGSISVHNLAFGRGVEFTITLPLQEKNTGNSINITNSNSNSNSITNANINTMNNANNTYNAKDDANENFNNMNHNNKLNLSSQALPSKRKSLTSINKIILVDDDELIQMTWKLIWTPDQLTIFSSPEQFMESIKNGSTILSDYDLIITDHFFGKLSDTTGIELAQQLKLKTNDTPDIILCSGTIDFEMKLEDKNLFRDLVLKEVISKEDLERRYLI